MFVLTSIKQTVRVPAHCFRLDLDQAIGEELNKKYANKVVLNVGLCIALWDIEKREESYILPGDGGSHTKVHFRFVVFRPFMEQILIGKIKNSSRQGVQISLGFFDDVWMPAENLQHPSRFDEAEHLWAWEYENDEGKHELFMDVGAEVRFRVVAETFSDTTPSGPGGDGPAPGGQDAADLHDNHIRRTPYLLTVASVILDLFFLHERTR